MTTKLLTRSKKQTKIVHPAQKRLDRGSAEAGMVPDSPPPTHVSRGQEPLEGALKAREAPESWQVQRSEAPEAGMGATSASDDSFTLGRSRS